MKRWGRPTSITKWQTLSLRETTNSHRRCFVKRRRAKSKDDFETWIESDVANTQNTFDGGDVRATTLVVIYEKE